VESGNLMNTQKIPQSFCLLQYIIYFHISAVTNNKHEMALKTLCFLDCGSLVDYLSLQAILFTHISVFVTLLVDNNHK